jgi:hypothetical protein
MSQTEDPNGEPDTGYLTVEVDEFKNKRSLRRFHDVYDMVDETFDEAYAMFANGQIQAEGRNIRVLKAVQRYIRTVYPLFMDYSRALEEDYADRHDDLDPDDLDANDPAADPVNHYWVGGRDEDLIGYIPMEHGETVVFNGLRDIMEAEEMYTESWGERVQNRHVSDDIRRRTETHTVPAWVSENAFNQVTLFLTEERDVIGLDFADEEHQTHIDRELLEEVDEWRRENVN